MSLFTFGHSTLEISEALNMLAQHDIRVLIDARSHPTSKWPQWHKNAILTWSRDNGLRYEWWPGLGGWSEITVTPRRVEIYGKFGVDLEPYSHGSFPRQRIGRPSRRRGWTNMGFWDYQFFMCTPEFKRSCDDLMYGVGHHQNVAYMCSESLWWKCHRSMIADYLLWRGHDSFHIQGARMHSTCGERISRYHPAVIRAWERALQH